MSPKELESEEEGWESVTGGPSNRQHNPRQTTNEQDLKLLPNVTQLVNGQDTNLSNPCVWEGGVGGGLSSKNSSKPVTFLKAPSKLSSLEQNEIFTDRILLEGGR